MLIMGSLEQVAVVARGARLALSQPSSLQLQSSEAAGSVRAGGHTHLALVEVFNDLVVQSLFQLALSVQLEAVWAWHRGCIRLL